MSALRLRTADLSDADAIARLVNAAYRRERFFIDHDRTNPDKVRALLEQGKFLLLEDWRSEGDSRSASALVGCVYVEVTGERGYFGLLAVDPQRQRAGLGAGLIAAVEQHCRAAGCRFMDLTVANLRTELPPFYRRLGYIESGTLPFPADQSPKLPVHLIQMSKEL